MMNLCFFPFSIKISKCSGSCNNITDPHSKTCVSDVVKNSNVKAFSLMSRMYVKWKGYDNLFNSWIDKKDIELVFS